MKDSTSGHVCDKCGIYDRQRRYAVSYGVKWCATCFSAATLLQVLYCLRAHDYYLVRLDAERLAVDPADRARRDTALMTQLRVYKDELLDWVQRMYEQFGPLCEADDAEDWTWGTCMVCDQLVWFAHPSGPIRHRVGQEWCGAQTQRLPG